MHMRSTAGMHRTRKFLLNGTLAVVLGALAAGCASSGEAAGGDGNGGATLVNGDLGGSFAQCQRDTIFSNWTKATGNKVTFGSPSYDTGAWKVQSAAGRIEWDLVVVDSAQL